MFETILKIRKTLEECRDYYALEQQFNSMQMREKLSEVLQEELTYLDEDPSDMQFIEEVLQRNVNSLI